MFNDQAFIPATADMFQIIEEVASLGSDGFSSLGVTDTASFLRGLFIGILQDKVPMEIIFALLRHPTTAAMIEGASLSSKM